MLAVVFVGVSSDIRLDTYSVSLLSCSREILLGEAGGGVYICGSGAGAKSAKCLWPSSSNAMSYLRYTWAGR